MVSESLSILWISFNLICLAFAAYSDWKLRLILDRIWLIQLLGGIGFLIYFMNSNPLQTERVLIIINILLGFLFLLVLIFTRVLGVGDMKGFFVISISYPLFLTYPENLIFPYPEIFPSLFALLLNFFLLLTGFAFVNLIRNVVLSFRDDLFSTTEGTVTQKLSLMIEGVKVDVDKLSEWTYYNPGEIYQDGKWQLFTPTYDSLMDDETFEELEAREKRDMLAHIDESNKSSIWIRPQVPGMVLLFLSFVITVLVGTPFGGLFVLLTS